MSLSEAQPQLMGRLQRPGSRAEPAPSPPNRRRRRPACRSHLPLANLHHVLEVGLPAPGHLRRLVEEVAGQHGQVVLRRRRRVRHRRRRRSGERSALGGVGAAGAAAGRWDGRASRSARQQGWERGAGGWPKLRAQTTKRGGLWMGGGAALVPRGRNGCLANAAARRGARLEPVSQRGLWCAPRMGPGGSLER